MKNIRIYKDDIRTHILRSLFFTDSAIVMIGIPIIALVIYMTLRITNVSINWNIYIACLIVLCTAYIAAITTKIDNQPITKIIPRAMRYKKSKKQIRFKHLDQFFTNFSIQDNVLIRRNSLSKVYDVRPVDIALLNDQDREHLFIQLKQFIHTLPTPIQILIHKEPSTSQDYSQHIFSLYKTATTRTSTYIDQYTQDLTHLISEHQFMISRYYLVVKVDCQTGNPYKKLEALNKLQDYENRLSGALMCAQIEITPLTNEKLINLSTKIFR